MDIKLREYIALIEGNVFGPTFSKKGGEVGLLRFTLFLRRGDAKIHPILACLGIGRHLTFCRFCEGEIKRFRFLSNKYVKRSMMIAIGIDAFIQSKNPTVRSVVSLRIETASKFLAPPRNVPKLPIEQPKATPKSRDLLRLLLEGVTSKLYMIPIIIGSIIAATAYSY